MRNLMIGILVLAGAATLGCGSDDKSSSSSGNYSAIADSIAHPTGTLDKTNAASIGTEFEKISTTSAAGRRVQGGSQSASGETACPAGGKMVYSAVGSESSGQVSVSYNQCCYEANCCFNGGGNTYYATAGGSAYTGCSSYNVSLVCSGSSAELSYEMCIGSSGTLVYVIHVDGKTFAVSGSYSSGSGKLEVTAANGTWNCTYANNAGTCTGSSGSITF